MDLTNPADAEFEIELKGTGRQLGHFEFKHGVDLELSGNNFIAKMIRKSSSTKGWFAEKGFFPVETKVIVDFNMNLNADMFKSAAGKRYAIAVKDTNLVFYF